MAESELLPTDHRLIRPTRPSPNTDLLVRPISLPASTMLYQRKLGSVLYAATTTRPDIAFAVSRLARFNQNPSQEHHRAADRVIQYLYSTRSRAIYYGGDKEGTNGRGRDKGIRDKGRDDGDGRGEAQSFICASDASFADNSVDRKSSQGYIMKLFGGPIAWRANKQGTTSSTEAELSALSQTAKGSYLHQQVVQSNDVTAKRALDYRQYPDTPTDHRRHGKVDHEASTSIDTGCVKNT